MAIFVHLGGHWPCKLVLVEEMTGVCFFLACVVSVCVFVCGWVFVYVCVCVFVCVCVCVFVCVCVCVHVGKVFIHVRSTSSLYDDSFSGDA